MCVCGKVEGVWIGGGGGGRVRGSMDVCVWKGGGCVWDGG